jgi:hypothetical protein
MAKIVKNTDLTKLEGDPGERAGVTELTENFEFRAWLGQTRGAGGVEMRARSLPRSNLGTAVATLPLTLSGCVAAGVLAVIVGAPVWVSCCGLLAPAAIYFGLRRLGVRPRRPTRRHRT